MNRHLYKVKYVHLVPDELKKIIEEQNLKHWWIADLSGMHQKTFQRWLSGRVARVCPKRAARVAKVLQVDKEVFTFRVKGMYES